MLLLHTHRAYSLLYSPYNMLTSHSPLSICSSRHVPISKIIRLTPAATFTAYTTHGKEALRTHKTMLLCSNLHPLQRAPPLDDAAS